MLVNSPALMLVSAPIRAIVSCQGFQGIVGSSCIYDKDHAPKQAKPGYKRIVLKSGDVEIVRVKEDSSTAPLKCGKYEHVERPVSKCPDNQPVGCVMFPEPPACAPDLHVVTEREWQELMARLKAMEVCKSGSVKIVNGEYYVCADGKNVWKPKAKQ